MKTKIINIIFLIAFAAMLGCSKDNIEPTTSSTTKSLKDLEISWSYYYDGSPVSSFSSAQSIEYSFADESSMRIYSFSTEQLFLNWAANQNYYVNGVKIDLVDYHNNLTTIGNYALNTDADVYFDTYGTIRSDVVSLMDSLLILPGPIEASLRRLYDNTYYSDQIHSSFFIPIPSLGNARDRAESLKQTGPGLNAYCDRRWFLGPRLYVLSVIENKIENLGAWNNRFESISPC